MAIDVSAGGLGKPFTTACQVSPLSVLLYRPVPEDEEVVTYQIELSVGSSVRRTTLAGATFLAKPSPADTSTTPPVTAYNVDAESTRSWYAARLWLREIQVSPPSSLRRSPP